MVLDDIPADMVKVLTKNVDRLFRMAGCKPMCHCCLKAIKIGQKFKLASDNGTDEMLCVGHGCDLHKMSLLRADRAIAARRLNLSTGGSGYSRPSR